MSVTQGTMDLQGVLKQLLHAATELLEIIEKEQGLLGQQDPNALGAISGIRAEKLIQFEHAQEALFSLLLVNELSEFKSKFEKQVALLPQSEQSNVMSLWNTVVQQLKKCSESNKVNGALVQKNLQLLRRKIDILTQRGEPPTYNEKGGL